MIRFWGSARLRLVHFHWIYVSFGGARLGFAMDWIPASGSIPAKPTNLAALRLSEASVTPSWPRIAATVNPRNELIETQASRGSAEPLMNDPGRRCGSQNTTDRRPLSSYFL